MLKFIKVACVILLVGLFAGCEWGGSGSDSTWSDSYSWLNFAGVYRPVSGRSFLVEIPAAPTNAPGSVVTVTQSLGTSDGSSTAHFDGTLLNQPIAVGSVIVRSGDGATYSLADGDGDGSLTGRGGSGTIHYDTGIVIIDWLQAPPAGENTIVTYNHYTEGSTGNPTGPTSGNGGHIYSLTLTQVGNVLDAIDNNGVHYHGELIKMSQGGGDSSGNTSGSVVGNFTMSTESGAKIVGVLTGNYIAPRDNGADAPDQTVGGNITTGKATDTETSEDPEAVTTGRLLNRQMQGTYIAPNGDGSDVQGVAGSITITVPQ